MTRYNIRQWSQEQTEVEIQRWLIAHHLWQPEALYHHLEQPESDTPPNADLETDTVTDHTRHR